MNSKLIFLLKICRVS